MISTLIPSYIYKGGKAPAFYGGGTNLLSSLVGCISSPSPFHQKLATALRPQMIHRSNKMHLLAIKNNSETALLPKRYIIWCDLQLIKVTIFFSFFSFIFVFVLPLTFYSVDNLCTDLLEYIYIILLFGS